MNTVLPPRKKWLLGAVILLAGLAVTWVDTRPHWDDTGMTVAAILLVSGLGAVAGLPPWLSAVLVAAPLLIAELPGGMGVLLAVPVALAGACVGAAIRKSIEAR